MRQFSKLIAAGIAAFLFSVSAHAINCYGWADGGNYISAESALQACNSGYYGCQSAYSQYHGSWSAYVGYIGNNVCYGFVYGSSCPSGQVPNSSGKCVPAPPECTAPKKLDTATNTCVYDDKYPPPNENGECAAEQTLTDGRCVPNEPQPQVGSSAGPRWLPVGTGADGGPEVVDGASYPGNCGGWECSGGADNYVGTENGGGCVDSSGTWFCMFEPVYTGQSNGSGTYSPTPIAPSSGTAGAGATPPSGSTDPCALGQCGGGSGGDPGTGGGQTGVTCNGGDGSTGVCVCPTGTTNVSGTCTATNPGGGGTTPVTCNGGDGSSGTCVCPTGSTNVNGTCTADSGTGGGTGTGTGAGSTCGGPGQPPCRFTIEPDATPADLSGDSKGIMGEALSGWSGLMDSIKNGGLNMHGVAFNWTVSLPSTQCYSWVFPIPGQSVVIDPCPTAQKIREIAAYALYFFTALTLAWILFGSGREA